MKIRVDDNVLDLTEKKSISTPLGMFDAYVLDLMQSSVDVIAGEFEGGYLLITNGEVGSIALSGYIDMLYLNSVSVDYMDMNVGYAVFVDSRLEEGEISLQDGIEIRESKVADVHIKADEIKRIAISSSRLEKVDISVDKVDMVILHGRGKAPLEILSGLWKMESVNTLWLIGRQIWDGGVRLEIDTYKNFIGELLKNVELKEAYVPRWIEWMISLREVEREFSRII